MKHTYDDPVPRRLTGRTVVMADGDEFGVVEAVVESADPDGEARMVVTVGETVGLPSPHVYVPQAAIQAVTDADVILGTRTDWIEPLHWTQPPADG